MCLVNLMTEAELKKFKRTLPKEFPVWSVMRSRGVGLFSWYPMDRGDQNNEPRLSRQGIYKAGKYGDRKKLCKGYVPGFHVFMSEEDARVYQSHWKYLGGTIQRFMAKRLWIIAAGSPDGYFSAYFKKPCIVLSHIEVRGRKKKQ